MSTSALLAFHQRIVTQPSPSHEEAALADLVESFLREEGADVERIGDNVVARTGRGPGLLLNSHLDTVPATDRWTRDPWRVEREGDRIYGLGSNDAKASVAAMTFAFLEVLETGGPCEVTLLLVPEEETGGKGAEVAWPALRDRGVPVSAVVVGEPTGLDVATSQKGLLILELIAEGDACHSANAAAQGARNPVRSLARDLVALEGIPLGAEHPALGGTTLEPTVLAAGERRNMIPGTASVYLDLRTVPGVAHEDLVRAVEDRVQARVRVHSNRLHPRECASDAPIIEAARGARPGARFYGSRTLSDLVYFHDVPAIKVGPGRTERSHTPDEYVLASEVEEGLVFYRDLIRHFAELERRMSRLWDKGAPVDDLVLRYTVGDDHLLDARLVTYDVRASIAHANMLHAQGYLAKDHRDALTTTLETLAREHADGAWSITLEEEDVHTALEARLTKRLGEDVGGRIHLGRSRNDQVLVALRLYLKDAVEEIEGLAQDVMQALATLTQEQGAIPLPGYTHLQRAMPSSVELWASAWRCELIDDLLTMASTNFTIDQNPLGSAAGYGTPGLDLDREKTTAELGFATTQNPVTSVQLSRGKAEAHVAFALSMVMQTVGRLSSELCLFATQEFGFVKLPDAFTTGSSIMPQKRNPDVFELIRARAAQAPAELQAIMAITAKMPSGYHRDLQLLKAPLFRALDNTAATLQVLAHALPHIRFDEHRTRAAMDPSLDATKKAYALVKNEGIPFREAYRRIARETGPQV